MKRLLLTCFGLGKLPVAPGTFGSLPAAVVFALLCLCEASAGMILIVMAVLALLGSFVCVRFAPVVIAATGKSDPGEIVADELAGQAVAFLAVAFLFGGSVSVSQIWITTGLGFLLFRLFDIVKPWPIHKLEKLPEGWGILADDILAGVFAAVILSVCFKLWIAGL